MSTLAQSDPFEAFAIGAAYAPDPSPDPSVRRHLIRFVIPYQPLPQVALSLSFERARLGARWCFVFLDGSTLAN